jgi:DNA modification methylase
LKVELVPISEVIPYARNPRKNDEAISKVAASLAEFGFRQPIVVDGNGIVVVGHTRLLAAHRLGMAEVPIHTAEGLTQAQIRTYRLADNRSGQEADWDMDLLRIELEDLQAEDFDLDLTAFSEDELERLLAEAITDGLTDPEDVPDQPDEPESVVGDLWILGRHRLVCGDTTNQSHLDLLMDGEQADMVFTDPPWNVDYGSDLANGKYKNRSILNDSMSVSDWRDFVTNISASLYSTTKHGAVMYCVMSAQEWPVIDAGLRDAGFHWSSTVIWVKDTLVISRKDYHTQYEPIWYGWNADGPRLMKVPDRKQSDIWHCKRPSRSPLHPTTKPLELIERAIENSSWRGALVLDLFGGSGLTLMASEKTGRKARLMELDPKYADVIVRRWENFTGKKAVRNNV